MTEAHNVIYLQLYDEDSLVDDDGEPLHEGVTWCEDRINERDVSYIRGDLFLQLMVLSKELFEQFKAEYEQGILNGHWPELKPLYEKAVAYLEKENE